MSAEQGSYEDGFTLGCDTRIASGNVSMDGGRVVNIPNLGERFIEGFWDGYTEIDAQLYEGEV
jgi:hypothetical protein